MYAVDCNSYSVQIQLALEDTQVLLQETLPLLLSLATHLCFVTCTVIESHRVPHITPKTRPAFDSNTLCDSYGSNSPGLCACHQPWRLELHLHELWCLGSLATTGLPHKYHSSIISN